MNAAVHNYFHEKVFFGTMNMLAAGASLAGGLLSNEEARWIYVTLAVGILVATSLALMTRKDEPMSVVVGRFLFAMIATVLLTRWFAHWANLIELLESDVLMLGAVSGTVCVTAFTIGYGMIRSMDQKKISIGKWLHETLLAILTKRK
jgi:hypothetical protein